MKTNKSGFGLTIIFVGLFLLLNNFGLISWDIWWGYTYLWPLIIIAVGIRMILNDSTLASFLPVLVIIAIPFVSSLNIIPERNFSHFSPMKNDSIGAREVYTNSWSIEKEITRARIVLDTSAANIIISSEHGDKLLASNVTSRNGEPMLSYKSDRKVANFDFESHSFSGFGRSNSEEWDLKLNKNIPWDITIESGASNAKIDLREIKLGSLDMDTGAGNVILFLGDNSGYSNVYLDAGAGNIELIVPESVGIKANFSTGIGKKELGNRKWFAEGDIMISENYASAKTKIDLTVSAGVGKLEIKNL